MKLLITGATGTIGKPLIKRLTKQEADIIAGVHSQEKAKEVLPANIKLAEMDYMKPETIDATMQDIDRVFLLVPFVPEQVTMAKNIIDSAKKHQVKQIVKLSFFGAGDTPLIELGRLHREVEQYIEASGIPYTFLRPTSFMQNFITSASFTIKNQGVFFMPRAEAKVSYIDVRDIASVAAIVLLEAGHENKIYQLTGPEALNGKEIANIFSDVLSKHITFIATTDEQTQQTMQSFHIPEWLVAILTEMNKAIREGKQSPVTHTIEELTGEKPITFRTFVEEYKSSFI